MCGCLFVAAVAHERLNPLPCYTSRRTAVADGVKAGRSGGTRLIMASGHFDLVTVPLPDEEVSQRVC